MSQNEPILGRVLGACSDAGRIGFTPEINKKISGTFHDGYFHSSHPPTAAASPKIFALFVSGNSAPTLIVHLAFG